MLETEILKRAQQHGFTRVTGQLREQLMRPGLQMMRVSVKVLFRQQPDLMEAFEKIYF